MAVVLGSFVAGFAPTPDMVAGRSTYGACTTGRNKCTQLDGKTCGKWIGDGTYSDYGFCYYKRSYARNCEYYKKGCEESNGDSNHCDYYLKQVDEGQCPQLQGGWTGGGAKPDEPGGACKTGRNKCTQLDGVTCGKWIGDGTYNDDGFCYYKKNYAGNCDYNHRGCQESGGEGSQCNYHKKQVDAGQCPAV